MDNTFKTQYLKRGLFIKIIKITEKTLTENATKNINNKIVIFKIGAKDKATSYK